MNVATYIYIIVPIVVVVVILKLCLIFCRAYVYHKRREEQRAVVNQQHMIAVARAQAARNQVMRITASNGQTSTVGAVQLQRPLACAGGRVLDTGRPQPPRRTIVLRCDPDSLMALRRSIDPNLPPSYDQAVSGRDRSVKVEDGKSTTSLPPPPEYSADNYGVPSAPVVHENSVHEVARDGDDQPLLP